MAVKYAGGGGGFNPLGVLSTIAMMVPGGQVVAPWLQLANAGVNAANGNWAGAIQGGVNAATGINGLNNPKPPSGALSLVGQELSNINSEQQADPTGQSLVPTRTQDYEKFATRNNQWTGDDDLKYNNLLKQYGLWRGQ